MGEKFGFVSYFGAKLRIILEPCLPIYRICFSARIISAWVALFWAVGAFGLKHFPKHVQHKNAADSLFFS